LSERAEFCSKAPHWLIPIVAAAHFVLAFPVLLSYRVKRIVVDNMRQRPAPQHMQPDPGSTARGDIRFAPLLYRFLFFDWLFADMTKARDLFERHAAWQHNRAMRRHLPTYLQRWSVLTIFAFGLGCLFEQILKTKVLAACFFTVSSITLTVTIIILTLWLLLSSPEMR
jgi:hypothetical protein